MNKLATIVSIALAVTACKKAADLSKLKDRTTALAAKYSPQLAELSKKLPDLAAHAKDLPVNVPGADKLNKLLADNKGTLESAQDVLAKLPAKLAADTPEQAEKDLDAADKALAADVKQADDDEKQEASIESTASAAPAAAAGSGSGSAAKK